MVRYSYDIDSQLDRRFKQFMLDQHGKVYGMQAAILQDALVEYLDRHEKSKAPPASEKVIKKRKAAAHQIPLEDRDPELAARIISYYGAGKRSGGHSRSETAKQFGLKESHVDKIIRREMLK